MQKQKGECISKTTQLFAELCWDLSWKRRAWDLPRTALHPMHAALQHQHKHKQLEEGRNTWVQHCWQGKRLCSHRHLVWIDLQAELGRPKGKMQCRNSKQRGGLPQPSYECLFQRTADFCYRKQNFLKAELSIKLIENWCLPPSERIRPLYLFTGKATVVSLHSSQPRRATSALRRWTRVYFGIKQKGHSLISDPRVDFQCWQSRKSRFYL